jgi:hypothetical protein
VSTQAWQLLVIYTVVLLALSYPLGRYIAVLMDGRLQWAARVESPLYRLCGVKADAEMGWLSYALAILLFNGLGVLAVYALQRLQLWLPLNPQGMANVSSDSSFNTAVSFATNTNWQGYVGESTMGYLTQMLGLTVQNFFSAATGIVVVIALIRGLARHSASSIGNAWVDLTRITLWLLLPLSLLIALIEVQQGGIQNFDAYQEAKTLEVVKYQEAKNGPDGQPMKNEKGEPVMEDKSTDKQILAMGPTSSQVAIKMLGTNGGGFFNANAAHPYENPTPLSNFVQMVSIFLIGSALCFTFGRMVGDERQGLDRLRRNVADVPVSGRSPRHRSSSRATRSSQRSAWTRRQAPTQAGGNMERQGDALRDRRIGALRHHHHRRLLRRGQRHARFLHAAGRHGAAGEHAARRSRVRRRRHGPVRHARVRDPGGLHRGPDDRSARPITWARRSIGYEMKMTVAAPSSSRRCSCCWAPRSR